MFGKEKRDKDKKIIHFDSEGKPIKDQKQENSSGLPELHKAGKELGKGGFMQLLKSAFTEADNIMKNGAAMQQLVSLYGDAGVRRMLYDEKLMAEIKKLLEK